MIRRVGGGGEVFFSIRFIFFLIKLSFFVASGGAGI